MSFEDIPDDLVPLTAHFKHLLSLSTSQQPILLFLDSVDQLTGGHENKLSWLPSKLPEYCKMILSCAAEKSNSAITKDYLLLRRMIDKEKNFIELAALGEELAIDIIRYVQSSYVRDFFNFKFLGP